MCSGEGGADMIFAWPSSEIAVMGAEGAANIIFRKEEGEERQKKIDEYSAELLHLTIPPSMVLWSKSLNPGKHVQK